MLCLNCNYFYLKKRYIWDVTQVLACKGCFDFVRTEVRVTGVILRGATEVAHPNYLIAAFDEATTALNAAASFIAISARILRSSSMPAFLRPFMKFE